MRNETGFRVWLFPLLGLLASCGGGGGGSDAPPSSSPWRQNVFQPRSNFDAMCVNPRSGTQDRNGTRTDENNWLRSWTHELYLWYSEVTDRDPSLYDTERYFDLLQTDATTASGQPKDK